MPKEQRCPQCGAELSAFATEGFCTACLLERGLSSKPHAAAPPLSRFGDYELIEEIARGGMGVVYKARQTGLNRLVAVKMILSGQFASTAELQRFRAEARAAAALQHPGIVAIHEVGEHEGLLFFSMDYVEGRNLAQLTRDGPWSSARAAQCVRDIAGAIHYAHERGVLHRDLKPSNVLVDAEGKPRVTDFGLAKQLADSQLSTPDPHLTVSGQVLGSPNFMPPEQAAGKHRELTPAADVYSLGALLYHLITGRAPFLADSIPATLRLVAEAEPVAPRLLVPGVPRDLETVCLKCLEKDPRRRYSTARELAEELNRFLNDEPIHARAVLPVERFGRWCRRHPAIAALTTIVGLLLVTVAVVSTMAAARLKQANREGQEKLRGSYLSQARANRWSGQPGQRFDSLEALGKAAEIRPGFDLRNEAIAAMALVDVRPVKHWPSDILHFNFLSFDDHFERYVRAETNGAFALYRTRDDQRLMNLENAGLPVTGAMFSLNDRFLAAAFRQDEIQAFKVYDLSDQGKSVFEESGRWVRSFAFSPDSRKLVVVWGAPERKFTVAIYETSDWHEVTSFRSKALPFHVIFNPSSDLLAVSSTESSSVRIHNAQSGELIGSLSHSNGVHCLSWDSTGRLLAAGCADHHIYLWDMSRSPASAMRLEDEAVVVSVNFSPQSDLLVAGNWHNWSKIWSIGTGKELLRWPAMHASRFSKDGRFILSQVTGNRVDLLQCASADECQPLHFRASSGGSAGVAYSPDGQMFVSTHKDGLRIWDVASSRTSVFIPRGDTRAVEFTRSGNEFITAEGSELFWWPITAIEQSGTNCFTVGPAERVSRQPAGVVNPTNRLVVAAGNKAYVIDAQSLRIERRITPSGGVYSAALNPDGHQCATWSLGASVVEVWATDDGRRLEALAAPNGSGLCFSPDGRWLVTASPDEYLFWERASWTKRHSISRGTSAGSHGRIAFTPDGRIVALSVGRGEVALLDATTFAPLATFEAPEVNPVSGIAFSPDGAQIAVSTVGQEIRLWNLAPVRRQLAELKLDYDAPPLSPVSNAGKPIKVVAALPPTTASPPVFILTTSNFPPRDARCESNHIDLTRFYNATLTNSWFNAKWEGNDLSQLPSGLQIMAGVPFDIRGVVQLSCSHPNLGFSYPKEVSNISVRQTCRVLYFLHSTGWPHAVGGEIGQYVIHYQDGVERTVPLIYEENIGNWGDLPGRTAPMKPGTTLAWRGRNRWSELDLVLFHLRWENPRPDVAIDSITFRSRMTRSAPFLIAITAE